MQYSLAPMIDIDRVLIPENEELACARVQVHVTRPVKIDHVSANYTELYFY